MELLTIDVRKTIQLFKIIRWRKRKDKQELINSILINIKWYSKCWYKLVESYYMVESTPDRLASYEDEPTVKEWTRL